MATGTGIEWTEATWNPVTGCARVSAGCDNCYAVKQTHRLERMGQRAKYGGLTVLNRKGDRHFSGGIRCHPNTLEIPLRWKKPRRIFVNSMSDLFHKAVPFDFIDKVFAVMALCPQHTFQVLTKRPERMAEYLNLHLRSPKLGCAIRDLVGRSKLSVWDDGITEAAIDRYEAAEGILPNVWLGTSVENQATADERIPHLLKCPAAVRFVSYEPALGPVDFAKYAFDRRSEIRRLISGPMACNTEQADSMVSNAIDWIIVGGESGAGARPLDVSWARSVIAQCRAAGVACFVKQLGSIPTWDGCGLVANNPKCKTYKDLYHDRECFVLAVKDKKGGDMTEWPEDLRVREFPK